ncbi:MAG: gluconolactonase [Variovorax paradoxus]|nr:MAG: gluconolactonase [Variovorax paradoxus]PZQ05724.1 MAG: gluconolactonase [Variovorax paradoxus]
MPATSSAPGAPRALSEAQCVWDAGAQLGEGALWSPRTQALWWVDILGRRLYRWQWPLGTHAHWDFAEEISAVAERADGTGLLLALRHGFFAFDPEDGRLTPLHRVADEPAHNRFNDGKCDAQGRFWAGSMDFDCAAPTGALYRFDPDGRCTRHDAGFAVTNGPTWSRDGRTLFFNDTVQGQVLAYDFDAATGRIAARRPWLRLAADDGVPDGMCTDAAGRIWIAHWGGSCVSCHDPDSAAELCRIALPARQITSCAFGGPDLRTLFITSAATGLDTSARAAQPLAGALFAVTMDSPGLPAHRFGSHAGSA